MRINRIFKSIRLLINKKRKGHVKDDDIRTAVDYACDEFFDELVDYYVRTGTFSESLRPLRKKSSLSFTTGSATLPTDFVVAVGADPGEVLDVESFLDIKESSVISASVSHPVMATVGNSIEVLPDSVSSSNLYYIYKPDDWFVYATTTDGDGRGTTFNEGGSTDIVFSEGDISIIINKALNSMGIMTQNATATEVSLIKDKKA